MNEILKYLMIFAPEILPVIVLGIVFFALRKNTSWKTLWLVLGLILPAMIVFRSIQWLVGENDLEMAIEGLFLLALYVSGALVGNFFNPRKIWHWLLGPVALLLVFLVPNIVSYFSKDYWHPFGTIVDEPLALDSAGRQGRFRFSLHVQKSLRRFGLCRNMRMENFRVCTVYG